MERQEIQIKLKGLVPIVFDRFHNHSKEVISPERKLYLVDGNVIVFPVQNLKSFLEREKPAGAIKTVEKASYKEYVPIVKSHVDFGYNSYFPFLDDNDHPIAFKNFNDKSRWQILLESPITFGSNGSVIKQEARPRPMMLPPWNLKITVGLWSSDVNTKVTEEKLRTWFETGGLLVGLGNHRPDYGRFQITRWES